MTKEQWNNFVIKNSPRSGAFLQSYEWGEFQESLTRRVLKIIRLDDVGLFLKIKLPLGKSYLYCPRGPIKEDFDKIKDLAKKEGVMFVRFEPPSTPLRSAQGIWWKESKKVPHSIPSTTVLLDLEKTEETLLKEMNQKTRYNIRLSEKKNLEIKAGTLDGFWKLTEETSTRHEIKSFPRAYYENLLKTGGLAYIKTVYLKNKPLASGAFIDFGGTTTYLFGASSSEHKNLMAPHFLHWNVIKEAKEKGMKYYDFWGINPENKKDPAYLKKWEGITRFKKGFGGEIVNYPGTFEVPIQKGWYRLYRLVKLFKK